MNEAVDEDLRPFAQVIEESGQHLMNTLNAMLDLAQLESEGMALKQKVLNVAGEVLIRAGRRERTGHGEEHALLHPLCVAAEEERSFFDLFW